MSLEIFIKNAFSSTRFDGYMEDANVFEEGLCHYLWNVELCETAFSFIHFYELSLRNRLNDAIREHYNCPEWPLNRLFIPKKIEVEDEWGRSKEVTCREFTTVEAAKSRLKEKRIPVTPDNLIGSLGLSFWSALFRPRYANDVWHPLKRHIMPYGDDWIFEAGTRDQAEEVAADIRGRVTRAKNFRNEVAHHNRLSKIRNLRRQYDEVVQLTRYMNPAAGDLAYHFNGFMEVYNDGPEAYQEIVDKLSLEYQGTLLRSFSRSPD